MQSATTRYQQQCQQLIIRESKPFHRNDINQFDGVFIDISSNGNFNISQISRPMAAVCNVENAAHSTRLLASTTLRFYSVFFKPKIENKLGDNESNLSPRQHHPQVFFSFSPNFKFTLDYDVSNLSSHISMNQIWMICAISLLKGRCLG